MVLPVLLGPVVLWQQLCLRVVEEMKQKSTRWVVRAVEVQQGEAAVLAALL
jgi:hypothetical protein